VCHKTLKLKQNSKYIQEGYATAHCTVNVQILYSNVVRIAKRKHALPKNKTLFKRQGKRITI
jgi:hypothetical protein